MIERRVFGVDLASASWSDNGSAVLTFTVGGQTWNGIKIPALAWPDSQLTPAGMAKAIDDFALANGVAAVALDGSQGWRAPETPEGTPGVGRRCEWRCHTQGKTGIAGKTYPQTQCGWVTFCIDVFEELLSLGHTQLGDAAGTLSPMAGRYWLLECFPTWTWKESGLERRTG